MKIPHKTLKAIALAALLVASTTSAQSTQPPSDRRVLSAAEAQADFDVLRRALEEAHGGFDRFSSKVELGRRFDAHRARIDRPLTQFAFAGIVSEAIAELRDGHGRLEYDSATMNALAAAQVLPLRLMFESERLVVLYNDSPTDSTIRPGMEVVSINGRAVSDLVRTLLSKISGDGFIETGKRARLARNFAGQYWLFIEQAENYSLVLRDQSGGTVRTTVPGILEINRRATVNPVNAKVVTGVAALDRPAGNIGLELIAGSNAARLRIRSFGGQNFPATLDSAFRILRERTTATLILDLRGNGGGVDEYGALLVSYFTDKPFRYFDHIHLTTIAPSFATWLPRTFDEMRAGTVPHPEGGFRVTPKQHSGVGEQQPAPNRFAGKVFVLIDGGSFSTTADVAAQLWSRGSVTFIGEETAGTYEGNTSGLNALVILPNSGLRMRVMMYGYWNAIRPPDKPGRGIIPHHVVTQTVANIMAGADPALEKALTLAR